MTVTITDNANELKKIAKQLRAGQYSTEKDLDNYEKRINTLTDEVRQKLADKFKEVHADDIEGEKYETKVAMRPTGEAAVKTTFRTFLKNDLKGTIDEEMLFRKDMKNKSFAVFTEITNKEKAIWKSILQLQKFTGMKVGNAKSISTHNSFKNGFIESVTLACKIDGVDFELKVSGDGKVTCGEKEITDLAKLQSKSADELYDVFGVTKPTPPEPATPAPTAEAPPVEAPAPEVAPVEAPIPEPTEPTAGATPPVATEDETETTFFNTVDKIQFSMASITDTNKTQLEDLFVRNVSAIMPATMPDIFKDEDSFKQKFKKTTEGFDSFMAKLLVYLLTDGKPEVGKTYNADDLITMISAKYESNAGTTAEPDIMGEYVDELNKEELLRPEGVVLEAATPPPARAAASSTRTPQAVKPGMWNDEDDMLDEDDSIFSNISQPDSATAAPAETPTQVEVPAPAVPATGTAATIDENTPEIEAAVERLDASVQKDKEEEEVGTPALVADSSTTQPIDETSDDDAKGAERFLEAAHHDNQPADEVLDNIEALQTVLGSGDAGSSTSETVAPTAPAIPPPASEEEERKVGEAPSVETTTKAELVKNVTIDIKRPRLVKASPLGPQPVQATQKVEAPAVTPDDEEKKAAPALAEAVAEAPHYTLTDADRSKLSNVPCININSADKLRTRFIGYIRSRELNENDRKKFTGNEKQPLDVLRVFVKKHVKDVPDAELNDVQKLFTYALYILNKGTVPTTDDLERLQKKLKVGKLIQEPKIQKQEAVMAAPTVEDTTELTTTKKQVTQATGRKRAKPKLTKPGNKLTKEPKDVLPEKVGESERPTIDSVLKRLGKSEQINEGSGTPVVQSESNVVAPPELEAQQESTEHLGDAVTDAVPVPTDAGEGEAIPVETESFEPSPAETGEFALPKGEDDHESENPFADNMGDPKLPDGDPFDDGGILEGAEGGAAKLSDYNSDNALEETEFHDVKKNDTYFTFAAPGAKDESKSLFKLNQEKVKVSTLTDATRLKLQNLAKLLKLRLESIPEAARPLMARIVDAHRRKGDIFANSNYKYEDELSKYVVAMLLREKNMRINSNETYNIDEIVQERIDQINEKRDKLLRVNKDNVEKIKLKLRDKNVNLKTISKVLTPEVIDLLAEKKQLYLNEKETKRQLVEILNGSLFFVDGDLKSINVDVEDIIRTFIYLFTAGKPTNKKYTLEDFKKLLNEYLESEEAQPKDKGEVGKVDSEDVELHHAESTTPSESATGESAHDVLTDIDAEVTLGGKQFNLVEVRTDLSTLINKIPNNNDNTDNYRESARLVLDYFSTITNSPMPDDWTEKTLLEKNGNGVYLIPKSEIENQLITVLKKQYPQYGEKALLELLQYAETNFPEPLSQGDNANVSIRQAADEEAFDGF